ncbi:MAG TPA: hypothetical protein G4O10_07690 [Dehalococcoidia bacterium]|nr:hypothetical protein [Dehalococcoidia bacterium]
MEQSAQGFASMMKLMFGGIGALSKAFYEQYGEEALPIIAEIAKQGGAEYGKIMQQMAPNRTMQDAAESLKMMSQMMEMGLEIVEVSDNTMRFKVSDCPLGIKGTSRGLCEALMTNDKQMMSTYLGKELEMKIPKSVAVGDEICEVIYSTK